MIMEWLSSSDIVAITCMFFVVLPTFIRKISDIDLRERLMFLSKILVIIVFATYVGLVIYDLFMVEGLTKTQICKAVGFVFSIMYCYWRLYFLKGKEMSVKEKLNRLKTRANNLR